MKFLYFCQLLKFTGLTLICASFISGSVGFSMSANYLNSLVLLSSNDVTFIIYLVIYTFSVDTQDSKRHIIYR